MIKILIIPLLFIGLFGCAAQPLKVDLSQTIYSAPIPNSTKPKLGKITFINKANDGLLINTTLGSDSIFPINTEEPTKETIEADLKRYLQERTVSSRDAKKSLQVVIHKADAYWVWSSIAKIPIFGLALVDADTEFGLNLKVSFEVEEGEKVVSTYWFDDVITIQAKATTQEKMKESYEKLIEKYRNTLFNELDSQFVRRYM